MTTSIQKEPIAQTIAPFLMGDDADDRRQRWFSIGDLSREFGVTLRTLRFYEDRGLLDPRREGLNRLYSRRDRLRLKAILMCKRAGFALNEIKDMLDLYDFRDPDSPQLRLILARFTEQLAVLEQQKIDIEAGLQELKVNIAAMTHKLGTSGSQLS